MAVAQPRGPLSPLIGGLVRAPVPDDRVTGAKAVIQGYEWLCVHQTIT